MAERVSLPTVTEILKRAGLIDDRWFTEESRLRGSALHLAARYLDEGDLDLESVDERVLPRLHQYERFKAEVQPEILAIEQEVRNEALRYCGHPDRVMRIGKREGILDLKPPTQAGWQALQVAMYAACFPGPMARWTLHLSDGRYQLIEHKSRDDWRIAQAAIALAAWKEANGNG